LRGHGFLVALVALVACGDPVGDTTLDITFDPCEAIELVPAVGTDAGQLAAIDAAAGMWRDAAGVRIDRAPGGAALAIRFEDAALAFRGVYLDEEGVVVVNRGLDGAKAQEIAIAHEIGHALGLWHVDDDERTSVMNPGNLSIRPNDGDAAELAALWGDCPPAAR
jgi:hypothetical protein